MPRCRALHACLATVPAALLALASAPALAHHPTGGETPETVLSGLLSGLGHPVLGLDHLAMLVGVGLIAARHARGALLPALFVVAMAAGALLHLGGVTLPLAEPLVAGTVIAAGAAAALALTLPLGALAALFGLAGLAHGHALAESIVGAEAGPLLAYLAGLVIVQAGIATGVLLLARRVAASRPATFAPRLAGLAVALVGVVALATA